MPTLTPTFKVTSCPTNAFRAVGGVVTMGTVSSALSRSTIENPFPPAIFRTRFKPTGSAVWPSLFLPHAITVPSDFSAKLWCCPAAIATTPLNPLGTVACPKSLAPHATTVPSDFNTRLWALPTATSTTPLKPLGTAVWP